MEQRSWSLAELDDERVVQWIGGVGLDRLSAGCVGVADEGTR